MLPTRLRQTRARALAFASKLDWLGPLVARLTLGVVFVGTGWGKIHSIPKVTSFFTELGIPAPNFHAYVVANTELIGGALLLIGLFSRFAAAPLAVSMLVAIATAQRSEIHGLADLFGLVEWTYLALLTWLLLAGPGRVSLDHFLVSRLESDGALPAREPARSAPIA